MGSFCLETSILNATKCRWMNHRLLIKEDSILFYSSAETILFLFSFLTQQAFFTRSIYLSAVCICSKWIDNLEVTQSHSGKIYFEEILLYSNIIIRATEMHVAMWSLSAVFSDMLGLCFDKVFLNSARIQKKKRHGYKFWKRGHSLPLQFCTASE